MRRRCAGEWYEAELADCYYTPYAPACAFLVLNGPSLSDADKDALRLPGIMTAGVNNGPAHFRPDFWFSVDKPARFLTSVFMDPRICKFIGDGKHGEWLRDEQKWADAGCPDVGHFSDEHSEAYKIREQVQAEMPDADKKTIKQEAEVRCIKWHTQWDSGIKVEDCPNVVYCKLSTHFKPKEFLTEPVYCMGNSKEHGGGRSVMLFALKALFVLGFRRVFLVGCDWFMAKEFSYGFEEKRHSHAVNNNNTTFGRITSMLVQAYEHFADHDFIVENCNPNSFLTAIPYRPLDEAIEIARAKMPKHEVTAGRYQFKL